MPTIISIIELVLINSGIVWDGSASHDVDITILNQHLNARQLLFY